MQAQDIRNVLELQVLFANHGLDTAGQNSEVLAALLDWKNGAGQNGAPDTQATKVAAPAPAPPTRTRTKRQTTAPTSAPADDTDF